MANPFKALKVALRGLKTTGPMAPEIDLSKQREAVDVHAPHTARSLVAKAETEGLALVSLMALLDCRGFWGNLLVPPFVFFFQKLYPFPLINNPDSAEAGAAGGCVLVRRDALETIGGIEAIRDALIDDCTLAAAIKDRPPKRPIWLGLTHSVRSLRDNRSLDSIWMMVARTAFTQLRHSGFLLVLSVFGMAFRFRNGRMPSAYSATQGECVATSPNVSTKTMSVIRFASSSFMQGLVIVLNQTVRATGSSAFTRADRGSNTATPCLAPRLREVRRPQPGRGRR